MTKTLYYLMHAKSLHRKTNPATISMDAISLIYGWQCFYRSLLHLCCSQSMNFIPTAPIHSIGQKQRCKETDLSIPISPMQH